MNPNNTSNKKNHLEQKILAAVDSLAQLILDLYRIRPEQDFAKTLQQEPKLVSAFQALCPLLLPMIHYRGELLPQIISQLFLQKMPYDTNPGFSGFYITAIQSLIATLPADAAGNIRLFEEASASAEADAAAVTEAGVSAEAGASDESITAAKVGTAAVTETSDDTSIPPMANTAYEANTTYETDTTYEPDTPYVADFEAPEAASSHANESNITKLERNLSWAFPRDSCLIPWTRRGYHFDAYLPRLHLVIRLGKANSASPSPLWLKKENLRLLWVDNTLLNQPSLLRQACLSRGLS